MTEEGKRDPPEREDESKLKSPKKAERIEDLEPDREDADAVKGGYGTPLEKKQIT
jgi:hypothetical protein